MDNYKMLVETNNKLEGKNMEIRNILNVINDIIIFNNNQKVKYMTTVKFKPDLEKTLFFGMTLDSIINKLKEVSNEYRTNKINE